MRKQKKQRSGISLFDLFALGFGSIIGAGWSATLNNLFKNGGGPIPASLGFAMAMIVMIPVALCFAELSPAIPISGGVVAYARRAFGKKISFVAGWFVSMSYIVILPWESISINDIIAYMFPFFHSGKLLYTMAGADVYLNSTLLGIAIAFIIFIINWRGIEGSAAFQRLTTFSLLAGSLICVVFALAKTDFANLTPIYSSIEGKSHTTMLAGVFTMFGLAPSYFAGFDTVPQSVETAKGIDPKSFGRIIIFVLVSAGLFYCLIFLSSGLAYPWTETINFSRPVLSNLFTILYPGSLGTILWYICIIATLAGLLSTWNGFLIAGSRLLAGMAKAGILPMVFAKEHPKYKVPHISLLFCSALMLIGPFLSAGVIDILSVLSSSGIVVGWSIAAAAAFKLRKTAPELPRPYSMPGGKTMAGVAALLCGAMFLNCIIPGLPGYMGIGGLSAFIAWSVLGIIFYLVSNKSSSH